MNPRVTTTVIGVLTTVMGMLSPREGRSLPEIS